MRLGRRSQRTAHCRGNGTSVARWMMVIAGHFIVACPDCAVGLEARQRVMAEDFWTNLVLAAAPFGLSLLLVLVIVRAIDRPRPRA
jgi:hypothetical protein